MGTLAAIANRIFNILPLNGKKTITGVIVFALSFVVQYFGDALPVQPDSGQLTQMVEHIKTAFEYLGAAMEAIGLSLAGLGVSHKVVKKIDK